MAHIDQDWVHGFANHHESIKWNLEKHRIKILSGECQQWPSQSTLIYMDFTCEAAHGACFTTIRQDMKTGCKISETRLNHSHGCQSHAWCKIWNQCKHISIPEGESWFWPHTDNAAVAPSKPFWRWPTLTKTESTVLPIIMNQSNGTWRNTESKFWVENANNGHHRACWFTWISPVRQLTALVSRQFGKTWRQDAKFLKPGWISPMGVRVIHDAKFETNTSTFQSQKESLDFGRMLIMQQWLLQSHFEDGPHWPRLSPQFCQSSWINQIEPGETQNQNFAWRMPTMAISEHIDSQGFHLWGSSRSLFPDNLARHEDRMQNFWNQVESFPWVSESCMMHFWNQHKHISIPEGESWFWPHTDNAAVAPSKPFWRWPTLTKTESTVLPIIMNQSNGTWRNTESKFCVENANNGHHRACWFTWISPVRQLTALVSWQFGKTWRQDAKFLKPGWIIPMGVRVIHDAKFETNTSTFQSQKESLDFGRMLIMQQWLLQSHFEDGQHWPRLSPRICQSS